MGLLENNSVASNPDLSDNLSVKPKKNFLRSLTKKQKLGLGLFAVLIVGLPVTILALGLNLDPRSRAGTSTVSPIIVTEALSATLTFEDYSSSVVGQDTGYSNTLQMYISGLPADFTRNTGSQTGCIFDDGLGVLGDSTNSRIAIATTSCVYGNPCIDYLGEFGHCRSDNLCYPSNYCFPARTACLTDEGNTGYCDVGHMCRIPGYCPPVQTLRVGTPCLTLQYGSGACRADGFCESITPPNSAPTSTPTPIPTSTPTPTPSVISRECRIAGLFWSPGNYPISINLVNTLSGQSSQKILNITVTGTGNRRTDSCSPPGTPCTVNNQPGICNSDLVCRPESTIPISQTTTPIPTPIATSAPVSPTPIPTTNVLPVSPSPVPSSIAIPVTPSPTPAVTYPASFSINTGSRTGGGLPDLSSDNNRYLSVRSVTRGSNRASTVTFDFTRITQSVPSRISLRTIVKSNGSNRRHKIYLYNYRTSSWNEKSSFAINRNERTVDFNVTSGISDYINPQGNLSVRQTTTKTGSVTHVTSYEMVRVTVTP